MTISGVFIFFTVIVQLSSGLYIPPGSEKPNLNVVNSDHQNLNLWKTFQQKLGLSDEKVALLKSQKDQQGTMDLLKRFIRENPKYITTNSAAIKKTTPFFRVYSTLLKQMKLSRSTLKTSLNFELADKSIKSLKRARRKIAVKMVSDIPTEKIDNLLKLFTEKHGIGASEHNNDEDNDYDHDESNSSGINSDYLYENLYEDEEDLQVPAKSHHNSEFGSFQDLILQAKRNQWQHEVEETKLRNQPNKHFV